MQAVVSGLVEARSGEIKIWAPVIGRISEIQVNANDKVLTGEALLRLDDQEARARIAMALAQVAMRKRAKAKRPPKTAQPKGLTTSILNGKRRGTRLYCQREGR